MSNILYTTNKFNINCVYDQTKCPISNKCAMNRARINLFYSKISTQFFSVSVIHGQSK